METKSLIQLNYTNGLLDVRDKEGFELIMNPRKVFDYLDISPQSRKDYKYRIGLFFNFMGGKELEKNSLLEYKQYLKNLINYSVSTQNHYLICAKKFLKEYHRQGILKRDITSNVSLFKTEESQIEEFPEEEISKILNKLKELPDTKESTRLKAIISLLVFQGLRQIEVSRLNLEDIDFDNKIMKVQRKGRDYKEPLVLQPKTIFELKQYIKTSKVKSGSLFFCLSNNHLNQRLTTRGIRKIVQNFLKSLDIERNLHAFRHSFCGKLSENRNLNTLDMAEFSGHHDPAQLQRYIDKRKFKSKIPEFYKCFRGWSIR